MRGRRKVEQKPEVETVWIVSLGDGTFVEIDERPFIAQVTRQTIEWIDENRGGEFFINCVDPRILKHYHLSLLEEIRE